MRRFVSLTCSDFDAVCVDFNEDIALLGDLELNRNVENGHYIAWCFGIRVH